MAIHFFDKKLVKINNLCFDHYPNLSLKIRNLEKNK